MQNKHSQDPDNRHKNTLLAALKIGYNESNHWNSEDLEAEIILIKNSFEDK